MNTDVFRDPRDDVPPADQAARDRETSRREWCAECQRLAALLAQESSRLDWIGDQTFLELWRLSDAVETGARSQVDGRNGVKGIGPNIRDAIDAAMGVAPRNPMSAGREDG